MPSNRARLSAKFVIERLRSDVAQQRAALFPGDHLGPRKWLNLISGQLDTADLYLRQAFETSVGRERQLQLIHQAARLAAEAYEYFVEFRGADTKELPFPIITPLQRWFTRLKVRNDIFFRANVEANYELLPLLPDPFRGLQRPSPSLLAAIDDVRWPMYRVTVPARAYAIIPHLAIVAHEVGHAVYSRLGLGAAHRSGLNKLHAATKKRHGTPALRPVASSIYSAWFQEFAADAVMFCITGPAGFFSLCEYSQLLGKPDDYSRTHPSSYLRRQALYKHLRVGKPSFAEVFKRHTGSPLQEDFNSPLVGDEMDVEAIYASLTRPAEYDKDEAKVIAELHALAPEWERDIYAAARRHIQAVDRELIYTPKQFDLDLKNYLAPMMAAVPPVEIGSDLDHKTPADFSSILNVGWVALLTKLKDLRVRTRQPDPVGVDKLERLHTLLLKAVELSEVRRRWEQA